MKTKIITFQYFQVVLQKEFKENDQIVWKTKNVFNFAEWLCKQQTEGKIKKNITVKNDFQGNLESVINSKSNPNIWFARFFKLRDVVPAKVKDGIGAESIELDEDEYIGEDVSILYDDSYGICMLQKNRFSLSYKKIAEWLTLSCAEGYRVCLRPISDNDLFEKIRGRNIRNFDISLANLKGMENAKNSSLDQIIRCAKYFDGATANIKIGVGRSKHDKLNGSTVGLLLNEIQSFKNRFSKAKVTISDDNDSNIEVLDLLDIIISSNICISLNEKKILDFNEVIEKMQKEYNRKRGELSELKIFPRNYEKNI